MARCLFSVPVKENRSFFRNELNHLTSYIGFSAGLENQQNGRKKIATLTTCSSKQHQHIHA